MVYQEIQVFKWKLKNTKILRTLRKDFLQNYFRFPGEPFRTFYLKHPEAHLLFSVVELAIFVETNPALMRKDQSSY